MFKKLLFFNNFLLLLSLELLSQEQKIHKFPPVKYISLIKDLNKYYLYANGGFHADWYVGYNNAWIVKLPPTDVSGYARAFIGVKLGRAKNISYPYSTNLKPHESKIFIAISNIPKFTSKNYVLCENSDIPFEPLEDESIEGVDSAKWFWTEIPISAISATSHNYVAVWAESRELKNSYTSPIIAAANYSDKLENVWLNSSIKGSLSTVENPLEIPVYGIKPAIVIKLIPQNDYRVIIKNFFLTETNDEYLFSWNVIGADIQKSWIEISYDKIKWEKISKYIFTPPYTISFLKDSMPEDLFYIKACATDFFENTECSNYIPINNTTLRKEGE